jgi:hypothetical protein
VNTPKCHKSFGQEKTEEDIRARIEWEMWAANKARESGYETVAQGHDLASVAYGEMLQKICGYKATINNIISHEDICKHLEKLRGNILFEHNFDLSPEAEQYHLLMLGAIEAAQRYAKLVVLKEADEEARAFQKKYK